MEQGVEIEAVFVSMKRSKSRKVEVDLKTMSFGRRDVSLPRKRNFIVLNNSYR